MDLLKPFSSRSFLVGLGVAALAYLLAPTIKQGARAVAVKGMQGAMMAGGVASGALTQGRNLMHSMKESVQDSTAVEQLISEIKTEREQFTGTLQEMMATMKHMQEEIATLRGNQGTV